MINRDQILKIIQQLTKAFIADILCNFRLEPVNHIKLKFIFQRQKSKDNKFIEIHLFWIIVEVGINLTTQDISLQEQKYFIRIKHMQHPQPSFMTNNYSPQKQNNPGPEQSLQNSLTPPKEPFNDYVGQGHHQLPTKSHQIIQYMKKKPFTQYLGGQEFTYSVLPKKQASFVLTHDRFLMLKGHQSISYARVFPLDKELPFKTIEEVVPPKATFLIRQIAKVQPLNNENLIIHFEKDKKKVTWEFICPSPSCAIQWRKKIEEALNLVRGIEERTVHPLAISVFDKEGAKFTSQLATNVANSNISVQANSPIKKAQEVGSPLKNKPQSVQFQGPQMNKVQDFILDPKLNVPEQQPFLGKSMSKITSDQKQDFKFQLTKIKRNWIQQLVGGAQQGQLIIDFRNYVQKIATVLISELYLSQEQKIFPAYKHLDEFASYFLDDVYIELYFINKDSVDRKHPRYELAKTQFKNMNYLLQVTQNQGILKVPFIVLFQYKGFLGMAKSKTSQNFTPKNKQCYSQLNIKQFQEISRISAQTLLNQNTCKILAYQPKTSISQSNSKSRIYFVDILTQLLPLERGEQSNLPSKQLRPQLVQDDQLDGSVFRDRKRFIKPEKIAQLIDQKENNVLRILQNQELYFTNSHELSELLHEQGLNIRRLGSIFEKSRLFWLRKILQAELLARSLKIYFKYDIQSCIRVQTQRAATKQRQQEIQHRRVISFLNVVFGVSESSAELWRRVNNYCRNHFGVFAFHNTYTDINIPFFLQAIQTHLRVVLTDRIVDRPFFKTNSCIQMNDFIRFQFESSIYGLDFTSTIEQIQQCLDDKSPESFSNLSQILVKETTTKVPYFEYLRKHPIHDKICQYLLDFTSPQQSKDLYNRLETNPLPSRFLYESKLAEIKWYLKQNKIDQIQNPLAFIFGHGVKWLGEVHPLYVQVNRILASYFADHPQVASRALKYAQDSLQLHKKIFGNDNQIMWKDYLLVGKAQYSSKNIEQSLNNLTKAKSLIKPQQLKQYDNYSQLNLYLCKGYFSQRKYKQAYTSIIQLYNLIKKEKDQQSLTYLLQAVNWIRQIYEINRQYEPFYQFLEKDFCNNLSSFNFYPNLLNSAVRLLTVPTLRHTILRRSKNKALLMSFVEQLSKTASTAKGNLIEFIGKKILSGNFPLSFLKQLKEADNLLEEISNKKLVDSWFAFYPTAEQNVLDSLSNLGRGQEFIVHLTALYNLYGKSMLDEIHTIDK